VHNTFLYTQCGQLLYRLQNGELPEALGAKVFWILIGTNDLANHCTVEAVVAGNIRVVQELQKKRPDATIVLNSILPRGAPRGLDMTHTSLWQNVQRVNQWLQCYADSDQKVEFFNATSLFVLSYDGVVHQVKNYFYDDVHPSEQGSQGWAKAIVQKVQQLIER
jgi:lysophospholipase L1-like esterase